MMDSSSSDLPPSTDDLALAAIRAGAWFAALPHAMQQRLLRDALARRLEPGEVLFRRGDAFDGLYAVATGAVLIHAPDPHGKVALLGLLAPGAWFGEICLFDGLPRTHAATASVRSSLLHLSRSRLDAMLGEHPQWWREFGKLLAGKTREAFRYVEEAQLLPPIARTARRLAAIGRAYGDAVETSRPLSIHLPQEQLGQMLGLSRQTVNQALRELEARGLLSLRYADIELRDLRALEEMQ